MKKIYFVVAAIVVGIVCLTVFSCMTEQPLKPLKRTSVVVFEGIQVRAETDKEIYKIGEPVDIKVFVKNLRNETIFLPIDSVETIILDSIGRMVLWFGYNVRTTLEANARIMPIEERGTLPVLHWKQTDRNREQVPPGIYTIWITVNDELTFDLRIMITLG